MSFIPLAVSRYGIATVVAEGDGRVSTVPAVVHSLHTVCNYVASILRRMFPF